MKVLILTHFMGRGGSSSLCLQISDVLRNFGHESQILATHRSEDQISQDVTFLFDRFKKSKKDVVRALVEKIENINPDIVYSVSGIHEMEVLRYLTIPRVRHFSSLESHDFLDIRYLFSQAHPYFDGITANTPDVIDTLRSWAPESEIHTATFPYALGDVIKNKKRTTETGSRSKTQICFIGRLERLDKRAHWLPKIIELVDQSQIPVEWHIYGDGPLLTYIDHKIERTGLKSRVHLHGWLPQDELVKRISLHDLFFLCSRWEGLPIAMVEAMLSGLAILVPDTCAGASYTLDSGGGWLYNASSKRACSKKLIEVISQPEAIAQQKSLAPHKAQEKFFGSIPAQQLFEFNEMLLAVRHNGKIDSVDQRSPFRKLPLLKYLCSRILALKQLITCR